MKGILIIAGLLFVVDIVLPLILVVFDVENKAISIVGTILILAIGLPIIAAPTGGYRSIGHFFSYIGNGIKDMIIFAIVLAVGGFIYSIFSSDTNDTRDAMEKARYRKRIDVSRTCKNCRYYNDNRCSKHLNSDYISDAYSEAYGCDSFMRDTGL